MIVITGASGNTGKVIAEQLLAKGKKVRLIARNADKLSDYAAKGAEIKVGDLEDPNFLNQAFEGAEAVYAMIPPKLNADNFRAYQQKVGQNICNAVTANNIKNIVVLSSVGAHLTEGAGVVQGINDFENYLNNLPADVNIKILRPGYFIENLFWNMHTIKQMGINGSPMAGDIKFPLIATRDIANIAANYLNDLNFTGKTVQHLLGSEDLSMNEVTKMIGETIGKPDLPYVQFPGEDAKNAMMANGMSQSVASAMVEFNNAANAGKIQGGFERNAESTTPTSVKDFLPHLAGYYNSL